MKLLGYIGWQLLTAFLFAVAGLLFVALPGIAVSTVHQLPNVDAFILLRFLPIVLQSLAPYVLPLCFMLAVVGVYGRLAADKEWIAIQMAGIHPAKMLLPGLALATALSGATYWMLAEELPRIKTRQKRFLVEATASVIENLQPGKTSLQIGDFFLKAAFRDAETGVFYDAYIRKPEDDGLHLDVFAGSAQIRVVDDFLEVHLRDVETYMPRSGVKGTIAESYARVDLAKRIEQEENRFERARYRRSSEILRMLAAGEVDEEHRQRWVLELHYRGSMAAAFFLFLLLGAPTGILLRRGTQLGALAIAAGYGIFYYVFNMRLGKQLGQVEGIHPAIGAWTTTLVGALASLPLLRKAMRR